MLVRDRSEEDRNLVARFLADNHSTRVARLGDLLVPLEHPALVAVDDGALRGLLTYVMHADEPACEILTLHCATRWQGTGSALLDAVRDKAVAAGSRRLWLITTNDNVDALRFYQRRGFHLHTLNAGAVDRYRQTLKPEIPEIGNYDIPIRDELILSQRL